MTRRHPPCVREHRSSELRGSPETVGTDQENRSRSRRYAEVGPRWRAEESSVVAASPAPAGQGGARGLRLANWREAWSKVREEMAEADEAMVAGDADRVKPSSATCCFSLFKRSPIAGTSMPKAPFGRPQNVHPTIQGGGGRHEGRGPAGRRSVPGGARPAAAGGNRVKGGNALERGR